MDSKAPIIHDLMLGKTVICVTCKKGHLLPELPDIPLNKQVAFVCDNCGEVCNICHKLTDKPDFMRPKHKEDKVEIESEEYKGYIERLTAPPAPIKITQEQLEDFLLNSRLTIKSKDEHNVYIISGAPASGKTTYVHSKIKQGDLVFDFDAICAALGGTTELYEDHKPYLDTALRVRDVIYEQIEKRDGKWHDAYVITASNDSKFVEALAERLNGTVITMKATREQCIERAKKDKRRQANLDKQIEIINEWFDTRS